MSRPRDNTNVSVSKSWTRKYNASQVGMGGVSRRMDSAIAVPPLTADAFRAQHSKQFDTRSASPARADKPIAATASATSVAGKGLKPSSSAGNLLPTLSKPLDSIPTDAPELKSPSLSVSYSTPNIMQALRDQHNARTASAVKLVHSFHSHHISYQYLVQKLTADVELLLSRSPPSTEDKPSRERIDGCINLLRELAAATPNSTTFVALVNELQVAIYNTPDACGLEFKEYDPNHSLTFFELAALMETKAAQVTKELNRAQERANYYEFHESGERHVLENSIHNWQLNINKIIFLHWRENVRRIRASRSKLAESFAQFEERRAAAKQKKYFLLWKYHRLNTKRQDIGPQVEAMTHKSHELDAEMNATNRWINEAANAQQEISTKLQSFQIEKNKLTQELANIQQELHSFKALKFQDVAHNTLDLARELLLSLEDELEHYMDTNGPFRHDGYLIIQKFVIPTLQEKEIKDSEKKTKGKKKNKASRASTTDLSAVVAEAMREANEPVTASAELVSPPLDLDQWDPISLEAKFSALSDPDILLQWFNYQLHHYHYRSVPNYDEFQIPLYKRMKESPPTVANFSSDFSVTRGTASCALLMLLESIAPLLNNQQSMNYLMHHEIDTDVRIKTMLSIIQEFNSDVADIVSHEQVLLMKSPDLMAAVIAKLFTCYPNLPMQKDSLTSLMNRLQAMKLQRRKVFSRLTNISAKHAEFDAVYVDRRRNIDMSRMQSSRFVRHMNRDQLLGVKDMDDWNDVFQEEEARKRQEQEAREAQLRKEQEERDALIAAEKAKEEETIRRAKETLGFAVRDSPTIDITEEKSDENAAAEGGGGEQTPSAPTSPSNSTQKKKKTRKQIALEFEKERLLKEEAEAQKAKEAAEAGNEAIEVEKELDPFSPEEAQIYVDYIQQFAQEFYQLFLEAKRHMDRIRRGELMYQVLQRRMENFILDVLVRRVNFDPLPIIDHKAHRDFTSFTNVPATRLTDVLPSESGTHLADLQLMQGELTNDYLELCSIFRAYSRVDHNLDQPLTDSPWVAQGCLLMQPMDYQEFLKDLKLQSRAIKQSALDEVFEHCTAGNVVSSCALSPNQWVEAIIRLAALKYPLASMPDALALFLKQDLLRKCRKLTPDLLRSKFQSMEYIELLRKHRRKLRKVFLTYCSGNGANQSTSPNAERFSVDLKDFTNILKFAKLLGGGEGLSMEDVTTVFVNVKRSEYVTTDNPPSDPELNRLDYAEYCQALSTLAIYKNPDPFTSFFGRLDHFFTRDFVGSNR